MSGFFNWLPLLWITICEPIKHNGQIRRGQIDALHTQVQVVDIDNGLLHQIPFEEIYCYPENVTKETSAIICMLPLFFIDGIDDLGQSEKLNPDKLHSFVMVSNKRNRTNKYNLSINKLKWLWNQ